MRRTTLLTYALGLIGFAVGFAVRPADAQPQPRRYCEYDFCHLGMWCQDASPTSWTNCHKNGILCETETCGES